MEKRFVYADYAATAPLSLAARDAIIPYMEQYFGNPNSMYGLAHESRRAIEQARADIAAVLHVLPEEVYFTGGGTEADNWALKGIAASTSGDKKHIIASPLEHPAIMHTLQYLEKEQNCEVSYLPVESCGRIDAEALRDMIRKVTVLVTCMTANNEIGTILDIAGLAAICREKGVLFHTDAVQAVGHIPVDASQVDLLSLSSHKFGGPKGVGALIVRNGIRLPPLIHGGGQENHKRAGTENVAGIVGMAAALTDAANHMKTTAARLTAQRKKLTDAVLRMPHTELTGDPDNRLPGLASFVIHYIEGESMVLMLDGNGICASSGSACSSGSLDPSHVLLAIGLKHEIAHGSLRLSLGEQTTDEDVDYIIEKLPQIVERLRLMSPLKPE